MPGNRRRYCILATPESELRKLLQKAEDHAARLMNTPTIRVAKWARTELMEEVGNTNQWKAEW